MVSTARPRVCVGGRTHNTRTRRRERHTHTRASFSSLQGGRAQLFPFCAHFFVVYQLYTHTHIHTYIHIHAYVCVYSVANRAHTRGARNTHHIYNSRNTHTYKQVLNCVSCDHEDTWRRCGGQSPPDFLGGDSICTMFVCLYKQIHSILPRSIVVYGHTHTCARLDSAT